MAPLRPFADLAAKLGRSWPHIERARQLTHDTKAQLAEAIRPFAATATGVVVFGSLGRGEFTSGSDLDWSLLVDGQSDAEHVALLHNLRRVIEGTGKARPNKQGAFGSLVSSHELIHYVGGTQDTNSNLTRRLLLLLESTSLTDDVVRSRVIRGVLGRYLDNDPSVSWQGRKPDQVVPRFLLNDIVRFWRTMAVDYAAKRWERDNSEWALRNVKLRFSRKLLFVAGLLLCLQYELDPSQPNFWRGHDGTPPLLLDYFWAKAQTTPLDAIALAIDSFGDTDTAVAIFDSYDRFLEWLDTPEYRDHLKTLPFEAAPTDDLFREARELAKTFQGGLDKLFYGSSELNKLIKKYGVF